MSLNFILVKFKKETKHGSKMNEIN